MTMDKAAEPAPEVRCEQGADAIARMQTAKCECGHRRNLHHVQGCDACVTCSAFVQPPPPPASSAEAVADRCCKCNVILGARDYRRSDNGWECAVCPPTPTTSSAEWLREVARNVSERAWFDDAKRLRSIADELDHAVLKWRDYEERWLALTEALEGIVELGVTENGEKNRQNLIHAKQTARAALRAAGEGK